MTDNGGLATEAQLLAQAQRQTELLASIDGTLKVFFWVITAAAVIGLVLLANM